MSAEASSPIAAPEGEVKMTIWEPLEELRKRIIYAALGMLITTILGWAFRVQILAWLLRPYENAWNARHFLGAPELQTLSPAAAFVGYLQLSLVAGFVGAAPIIFYQLWAFVSPGLYHKEKRLVVPFVFFSTTLFLSGVAFGYYIAFPVVLNYFFSLLGPISNGGAVLTQQLVRFGRWAVLASFIIGAIISPGPDVSSQIVMSLPLILLYFVSVGV